MQQRGLPTCVCVLFWGEGYFDTITYIQDECGVDGGLHCRGHHTVLFNVDTEKRYVHRWHGRLNDIEA